MEMVKVYDPETKATRLIPAAELAPGMIQVDQLQEDGSTERLWEDVSSLHPGPHRHTHLPDDVRAALEYLSATLADVYPKTVEEWEDGFRRDLHWRTELAICLRMAKFYSAVVGKQELPLEVKQDIFQIILLCTMQPRHLVASTATLKVLTRQEAEQIANLWFEPNATR